MEKATILIVDDHTLVRQAWSFVLNNETPFQVIAECGSGEEAIEITKKLQPGIVIMDINLPAMNGIEATQSILEFAPGTKILGVSVHTQLTYVRQMLKNGAWGYITKHSSKEEMLLALKEINAGRKYICNDIKNILSEKLFGGREQQSGTDALSRREVEIISFIKKGLTSKETAEALGLSVKTVEVHRYNILKKLNLRNTTALINFVNQNSLIPD
jgi:two-component system invasion response regulator UvrY